MYYLAAEEYLIHNRQRELAKELGLRRRLLGTSESTTDAGSHFRPKVADQLRNLVCRSESGAGSLLDCVTH